MGENLSYEFTLIVVLVRPRRRGRGRDAFGGRSERD